MLTTCPLSIQLPLQESINAPSLHATQIFLFAQVNLDQSDEVTSDHEYKSIKSVGNLKHRHPLQFHAWCRRKAPSTTQASAVLLVKVSSTGSPSCPGTAWQHCTWYQSKTRWIFHKHTAMGRAVPTLCMIAMTEKVFYQAVFFFLSAFWEREWCQEWWKSKTRTYLYALGYFFDFTSWEDRD